MPGGYSGMVCFDLKNGRALPPELAHELTAETRQRK
jgi:hypothetical protein